MSKSEAEIRRIVDMEAEESEKHIDDPAPAEGLKRRPGTRNHVYSVRLTAEQAEQINAIAAELGIPASGLVRGWVLQGIDAHDAAAGDVLPSIDQAMNSLRAIRSVLAEQYSESA